MNNLRRFFEDDGGDTMRIGHVIKCRLPGSETILEVLGRLHIKFEANTLYVSFYIPATDKAADTISALLDFVPDVLDWRTQSGVAIAAGRPGEAPQLSTEAQFTGRVYAYSETPVNDKEEEDILRRGKELRLNVKIRSKSWAEKRSEWKSPPAFISHDFRDKNSVAKPLALELQRLGCPVWYAEFSLKVGDSLRESIERGLRECRKCIFVVTPHFLANGGWAKREYDSIFTRELVERQNVILPVWRDVTLKMVYEYSPILADRMATIWENDREDNVGRVAVELLRAIRS